MRNYTKEFETAFKEYFDQEHWNYIFQEKTGQFRMNVSIDKEVQKTQMLIDLQQGFYQVYAYLPLPIPDQSVPEIERLLNYFNCHITFGHFEMNIDHMICFRLVSIFTDSIPAQSAIKNSIFLPIYMVAKYGKHFMSILNHEQTAEEIIQDLQHHQAQKMN